MKAFSEDFRLKPNYADLSKGSVGKGQPQLLSNLAAFQRPSPTRGGFLGVTSHSGWDRFRAGKRTPSDAADAGTAEVLFAELWRIGAEPDMSNHSCAGLGWPAAGCAL